MGETLSNYTIYCSHLCVIYAAELQVLSIILLLMLAASLLRLYKFRKKRTFSVCSLFGTTEESRTEDFILHRLQSKWSEEGRLRSESFLDLQMEPS